MANIEEKVEDLVKDKINELGYDLYDVEYTKEGKNYFLRIFIDNEKGIDLEDCEKVNDGIMDLLDKADYIKEQYFLEDNIGKEVEISLFKPIDKKKKLEGILKNFNKDEIILDIQNTDVNVERKNISLIKTKYNWNL